MEKVWFKLRQTHYPPGPEASILAGEGDDTNCPIALGHCIPDLKRLEHPINAGAIVAFPTRMKVFRGSTTDFTWDAERKASNGVSIGAGAPLAAAMGLLTVKASVQLAFERSISEHERYARLDTYFVQPNRAYVETCLKTAELKRYVGAWPSRSFFMITGIRVARGGSRSVQEASRVTVQGGPEVEVPGMATLHLTKEIGREKAQGVEEGRTTDFIWAVRLAKVHKGILMTDWSIDPYTRRATFGADPDDKEVDVAAIVSGNSRQGFKVIEDEELNEAIVVDEGDWEQQDEEQD
ncbi:hypothetical protein F4861DRAFT_540411 [Xylaria intraflava]|nr:hypothetical protein F4861DRAFT_540411 [Xylaria intraflava]